jgi:acetylornithine deacetylase/succinyl-diaminopimelate desuccinylase-like protein
MSMDLTQSATLIATTWANELVPQLQEYIAIPALSPHFDPDWEASGHIQAAVDQISNWIKSRPIKAMTVEIAELAGRTPLIVVEVEPFGTPSTDATIVLYGHLDKQPEMTGWREGLSPWTPVIEGDKLYGRGGADDGYAAFASLTAIEAVQTSGGSHARCILLVEASEESGSPDLPAHVDALASRLTGTDLVLCLDSGCANYETLWLTTSLRGLVAGVLSVDIVSEGLHSGSVGGVVPSTFRIARQLLDRIEDVSSGTVLLDSAAVSVPGYRAAEAQAVADAMGADAFEQIPLVEGARLVQEDVAEQLLARTWAASLSVIGADGLPATGHAGNVLRPNTSLELSMRIPPTADAAAVRSELTEALTSDPPYGAAVSFDRAESSSGWHAPDLNPWLADALENASQAAFGQGMQLQGEGGSIPFMGMLGEKFPDAQFVITGVLGPGSNAHGPNEYLHLPYAEKLTQVIANVLDAHGNKGDA